MNNYYGCLADCCRRTEFLNATDVNENTFDGYTKLKKPF